jgi:hypothetical protein
VGVGLLLAVAALGADAEPPAPPASSPFALPTADALARAAQATLLATPSPPSTGDGLLKRIEAFVKTFPPAERDVVAATASIEPGVEAALRFVRERIAFEPYRGVLRGPQGTFATRAGNAWDRSLLLAWILGQQGATTRYARGRLSAADAQALIDRLFSHPPPPPRLSAVGLAPGEGTDSLLARVAARARRDYARIRAALGASLPAPERATSRALEDVGDHVWVQVKTAEGWTDVDPSFDDPVGKARVPAEATLETLPPEMLQTVALRVVSERLEGTAVVRKTVLELTRPAAALLDQEIFLFHLPANVGGLAGAIAGVAEKDAWRPALLVAGELMVGEPVEFDEGAGATRGGPPGRGGLGGAFGPGGALGSRRPPLVAEWLEVDVAVPGAERETTRRPLFDRAGAAWRRSAPSADTLRPIARDEKGPLAPRSVHNVWVTAGRHDLFRLAAAAWRWADPPAQRPGSPSIGELFRPFALQSATLVAVSDELVVSALNDAPGVRFYADSPRVAVFSIGPRPRSDATDTGVTIDLRRDRLRGLARDASGGERAVVERRIWFGALQGALEHESLLPYAGPAGESGIVSTSSRVGDGPCVLLQPAEAANAAARVGEGDAAATAEEALRAGRRLVVAATPPADGLAAWWEVSADGTTRAVLDADLGAGFANGRWWWWEMGEDGVERARSMPFPAKAYMGPPRGAGTRVSPPGVIPHMPDDILNSDRWFRQPTATVKLPSDKTRGGPRPAAPERSAQGAGGGNEYTMIVAEQAVPNPLAILDAYVDRFLVGSGEVAGRLATYLDDLFRLFG